MLVMLLSVSWGNHDYCLQGGPSDAVTPFHSLGCGGGGLCFEPVSTPRQASDCHLAFDASNDEGVKV